MMHTPLQIQERNVLRDLVTDHPIYLLITNAMLDINAGMRKFQLFPEDIFLEVIDLIDTIREINNDEHSIKYIKELKVRMTQHYAQRANQSDAMQDINLYVTEVLYAASCALSITKTKPYSSVTMALQDLLSITQKHKLLPYFLSSIKLLSNEKLNDWEQYIKSDDYLADKLITAIENADYFYYIVREAFKDNPLYTLDSYENQLRTACTKGAPNLIRMLKRGESLGYLDFEDVDIKTIYDALVEHFPNTIDYGYKHFANTAKTYDWHSRKTKHDNHRTQK
jgi:hypothetical protein